jgi:hypothetical protein
MWSIVLKVSVVCNGCSLDPEEATYQVIGVDRMYIPPGLD